MFKLFDKNLSGRDFVVGGIHGCFADLEGALAEVEFNPDTDRLFAAGGLVEGGPEPARALKYLEQPWFHSVRGADEQTIIDLFNGNLPKERYSQDGGDWYLALPRHEQKRYVQAFQTLPNAIELESPYGTIGIVHADCPLPCWREFCELLPTSVELQHQSKWNKDRIPDFNDEKISGVRAVVVGHMALSSAVVLGNVYHIDTAPNTERGHFTLLEVGHHLSLHEMKHQHARATPFFAW